MKRNVGEERDKALREHWKERHEAGTCGIYCYICASKKILEIYEEAKKEGRVGFV